MLTSCHFGAGQYILGEKKTNMFFMKNRWKREKWFFEFVTEQGIASHLDISNIDIIYKIRLFVTNKKKWKKLFSPPMTLLTWHRLHN